MAVYDDQTPSRTLPSDEDLRSITGIDGAEEQAMEENLGDGGAIGSDELQNRESADDGLKSGFPNISNETKALKKSAKKAAGKALSKKKLGTATILATGLAAVLAFFTLNTSQPLAFIKIYSDLQGMFSTMENVMDSRLGKAFQHAKGTDAQGQHHVRSHLSVMGNALADSYERRLKNAGIDIEYNSSRRIARLNIDTYNDAGWKTLERMKAQGIPDSAIIDLDDGKGTVQVDLTAGNESLGNTRQRRLAISSLVGALDMNKVASALSSRILKVRGGVTFHPLRSTAANIDERIKATTREAIQEWKDKRRADRANAIETGQNPNTKLTLGVDAEADTNTKNQVQGAQGELNNASDTISGSGSNRTKVRNLAISGVGVTAVVGLLCTADAVGDMAVEQQWSTIAEPLMRLGMFYFSLGQQMAHGTGFHMAEVEEAYETLFDDGEEDDPTTEDINEFRPPTSFFEAASYQGYNGQDVSHLIDINTGDPEVDRTTGYDMPLEARPSETGRPAALDVIDKFLNAIPGANTACGAVTSTVGGWLLDGAGILLTASGPLGIALGAGGALLENYLAQKAMPFIVGWLSGNPLDVASAFGATLGNYTTYGVRLSANEAAISSGGSALTTAQSAAYAEINNEIRVARLENKSFIERYLDITDHESLASNIGQTLAVGATTVRAKKISSTLASLNPLSTIKNAFTVKTAAANMYDFGFPEFNPVPEVINSNELDDPYVNADIVENQLGLDNMNAKYGIPCFGVQIDPVSGEYKSSVSEGQTMQYSDIDARCKVSEEEKSDPTSDYSRFATYILDFRTILAATCYEGEEDSESACRQIGVSFTSDSAGETPTTGGVPAAETTKDWTSPVPKGVGARISSGFGIRWGILHAGTDFAYQGDILAACTGVVTNIDDKGDRNWPIGGDNWKYSNHLVVDCGGGVITRYHHYYRRDVYPGIEVGAHVKAGTPLAKVGNQGQSSGAHLHFEVRVNYKNQKASGQPKNPVEYFKTLGIPLL